MESENRGPTMTASEQQTTEPVIQLREVSKIFRDFWGRKKVMALERLSFQVKPGEVFGLLGPNGSGKSTTMKLILGLLYPSAGQLRIFGRSPQDVRVKSRIGYMPEESYLYPYLTATETLTLYSNLLNLTTQERQERIAQLLAMVGLAHTRQRAVGEFSKGMARRISLAQALLNDPELLLLDEPTSGLDPLGCRQFKDLILKLADRGKTIILCSHLLADVEDVCHRVTILFNGELCAEGSVREMLEQKSYCRVAFPNLPPSDLADVLQILRDKAGVEPTVDHPTRSLEDLFLETIAKARTQSREFSGARPDSELAPFLRGTPARSPVQP